MQRQPLVVVAICMFVALVGFSHQRAFAISLLGNGGFETGDLSYWSTDQWNSSGLWLAKNDTTTLLPTVSTVGPASGSYFALGDEDAPTGLALYQNFTLPTAGSVTVSFDLFANNYNDETVISPDTTALDPSSSVGTNQYCRVDLMSGGSDPLDTVGVIDNLYLEGAPTPNPNNYTPYTSGPLNLAAGTYMLRFGLVSNAGTLDMGVDNVSADYQPVPEPGTLACLALGLLGLVEMKRRRHRA